MAIGSATIGAGLAIGGAILGGNSANKAASQAANQQAQVAQQNNALTRDIYNQNKAALSPFANTGVAAGNQLNALLGLAPQASTSAFDPSAYLAANPDVGQGYAATADKQRFRSPEEYAPWHYAQYGQSEGRNTGSVTTPGVTQAQAQQGFTNYLNGSDAAFQQATGNNALAGRFAGIGAFQSGAAIQDQARFNQNLQAGYRNEYMNALANQQGLGLGAASAQAGVGQNYSNTINGNNQNAANAASNAALIRGQNNPLAALLSGAGGFLGGLN